jgi:hypothetical protein
MFGVHALLDGYYSVIVFWDYSGYCEGYQSVRVFGVTGVP